MTTPVVLVLDDMHTLHNRECQAALWVLADHVPGGSRLVLAGRAEPPLRMARLRAQGRILEIGPADLALALDEATLLLRNVGVVLGEDEVTELHRRTEGWPPGCTWPPSPTRPAVSEATPGSHLPATTGSWPTTCTLSCWPTSRRSGWCS